MELTKTEQVLIPLVSLALSVLIYFSFQALGLSPSPKVVILFLFIGVASHLYALENLALNDIDDSPSVRAQNFMACAGLSLIFMLLAAFILAGIIYLANGQVLYGLISWAPPLIISFLAYRVKLT